MRSPAQPGQGACCRPAKSSQVLPKAPTVSQEQQRMEGPVWMAATPSPGPGARGQRNLQRQLNEGQFTLFWVIAEWPGSEPLHSGAKSSSGKLPSSPTSYLGTTESAWLEGPRGSISGDPLPESLMLSAFSGHMDPQCTPSSLLPPITSSNPSRPGGAGSYLSLPLFHSCQSSSPWAKRGSSLFSEEPLAGSSEPGS